MQTTMSRRGFVAGAGGLAAASLAPNLFGIAANRLRNVPERMPRAWSWVTPAGSLPQQ